MHIEKEKLRVTALIDRFRLVGDLYKYPGARLLDLTNIKDANFLPLTDVEIYNLSDNKLVQKTSFMVVNIKAINFFYPVDSVDSQKEET